MKAKASKVGPVLRNSLRALVKLAGARATGKVAFPSDAKVIRSLRPDGGAVSAALGSLARGDSASARHFVVRHFRERVAPRAFLDRTRIGDILESVEARHPEWKQQDQAFAAAWCSSLGAVYGALICQGGTIDWDNLPPGPGDDHLYRDRLHMFAFAPLLARSALYGVATDAELLDAIRAWMRSTQAAADPDGYSGCLIVAYRIVALSWTHAFLVCKPGNAELEFEILRILLNDIDFVVRRLGTSFPNNHLLADGFVAWFAGMLYPEFVDSSAWLERGERIWLRELDRQIHDDGTSFEHASHYQAMACEMAASYVILNRLNDRAYPEWVDSRMRAMLRFHGDMMGPDARPLQLGDGVEDPLLPLGDPRHWGRADYSGLLSIVFADETGSGATRRDDQSAFWLAGGTFAPTRATMKLAPLRCYPRGGIYLFEDVEARTRLLFRTGPVAGLPVNPGHMHADLLSILVDANDIPVVVDPGTYTYRSNRTRWLAGSPGWRGHFMGPVAHNGMAIEGEDPLGRGEGDFPGRPIRSHVAIAVAIPGDAMAWVEAVNHGDTAYSGHRRGVVQVGGHYHLVYDALGEGRLPGGASFGLQFASGAQLEEDRRSRTVQARVGDAILKVATTDNLFIDTIAAGQESPPLGWQSPRYGELRPAPMLRFGVRGNDGPYGMLVAGGGASAPPSLVEGVKLPRGAYGFRVTTGRHVDYVLMAAGADQEIVCWNLHFAGSLLWLRISDRAPRELRWLRGRSARWGGMIVRTDESVDELIVQALPAGNVVKGCAAECISIEGFAWNEAEGAT